VPEVPDVPEVREPRDTRIDPGAEREERAEAMR